MRRQRLKVVVERRSKKFSKAAQIDLIHRIGQYCSALAGVVNNAPVVVASGTLITVKGRGCLLTAHHVLYGKPKKKIKGILDYNRIGIYGSRHERQPTFPREWFIDVPIKKPGIAGEPDLAALILPDKVKDDLSDLSKTFYNLDLRKSATVKDAIIHQRGEVILTGAPWESRITTPEGLGILFMLGHVMRCEFRKRRGFHFVKVGIGYSLPARPPRDFRGVSGGGLWVVPTAIGARRQLNVSGSPILAGVAFIQTKRKGKVKSIRCHAPRDIYGVVRRTIAKKLKERKIWLADS